jgi:hypothetical protein
MSTKSFLSKAILLLIGSLNWATLLAQKTFFTKMEYVLEGADILEDYEGGLLVLTGVSFARFDPDGVLQWIYDDAHFNGRGKIRYDRKNKLYITSAQSTSAGGYKLIAFNLKGEVVWQNRREFRDSTGFKLDVVEDFIIDTVKNQIVISGCTMYRRMHTRNDYWLAIADMKGNILREERVTLHPKSDRVYLKRLFKTTHDDGYVAVGHIGNYGPIHFGYHARIFRFDSLGRFIEAIKPYEGSSPCGTNYDVNMVNFRDFGKINDSTFYSYLNFSYYTPFINREHEHYLFIYNSKMEVIHCESRDTDKYDRYYIMQQYDSFNIRHGMTLDENFSLDKYSKQHELLWTRKLSIPGHPKLPEKYLPITDDVIVESNIKLSNNGGYYGYLQYGYWVDQIYVFRLDSLGRLYPNPPPERPELVVPVPNPARGQIRFDMPYHNPPLYPRHIRAVFYDMQGRPCLEVEGDKYTQHDISALRPGMYVVKTRIRENGEERTLKVMVE